MGMAASQARFLGLTARKSNVEYQGQQVNQERTALANDSANLYNQMMALDVPTPPSANEYYKTYFVLEDSAAGYATTDYRFQNANKTYDGENRYSVVLTTKREYVDSEFQTYRMEDVQAPKENETDYKIDMRYTNSNYSSHLLYDPNKLRPYQEKEVDGKKTDVLTIDKGRIYKADSNIKGFKECYGENPQGEYYFFQDSDGKNHFISEDQLLGTPDKEHPETRTGGILSYKKGDVATDYNLSSTYVYTKDETITVDGRMESSETGRYSTIKIDDNEKYGSLSNKTFTISTVQEKDDAGYEQAYNDYQYHKDEYEHTIDEINAQTEIIQNEDKQLELRLRELETEQNAISTEMDSVKKVIEDNVEKTFNIFG